MADIEEPQENYVGGWIKLYRSIENKGWYRDSEYVHLWIHLLIKANHRGKEFLMNGEIVKLNPGQFVTGRKSLSAETSISESKIERILNLFESERQIEQQTNSRNRVITIVSWDTYQKSEQQMDSQRTASGQPADTNKNDNNEKNEKKVSEVVSLWNAFAKSTGCSQVKEISKGRRRKILTRLSEDSFKIEEILERAKKQTFALEGKWFTFDWIVENDTNYLKVLEMKYMSNAPMGLFSHQPQRKIEKL